MVSTPAIVLSTFRYRETSKIVRLATLDLGVQSVIAKGAMRPRSRFGASLQVLSEGTAMFHYRDRRELQTLTAFDPTTVHLSLTDDLERFAGASVLAELMIRFAPADRHQESFQLLRDGLDHLEQARGAATASHALRLAWQLVASLGYAPVLDSCARDGAELPTEGTAVFSPAEGGMLCRTCGQASDGQHRLPVQARHDLVALLAEGVDLPVLDEPHAKAHRRLFAHYVHYHLADGRDLPALEFWLAHSWSGG